MKRCEEFRETLIDRRYGLLAEASPESEAARRHLANCDVCASDEANLSRLLGSLRPDEAFPRERDVDWDSFARRTTALALAHEQQARRFRLLAGGAGRVLSTLVARPLWSAAAALIVTAGLSLLLYQSVQPPRVAAIPAVEESVFVPEGNIDHLTVNLARSNTARYLMETRAVLVTLLDVGIDCDKDKVDISAEKAKAMDLLRRQRLVANELNRLPLQRAQDVCGDLERLLLEIASLGDCTRDDEIQTLRDVVEQRQILVRMELLSQELATRGGVGA